jgi:hypothetical protein
MINTFNLNGSTGRETCTRKGSAWLELGPLRHVHGSLITDPSWKNCWSTSTNSIFIYLGHDLRSAFFIKWPCFSLRIWFLDCRALLRCLVPELARDIDILLEEVKHVRNEKLNRGGSNVHDWLICWSQHVCGRRWSLSDVIPVLSALKPSWSWNADCPRHLKGRRFYLDMYIDFRDHLIRTGSRVRVRTSRWIGSMTIFLGVSKYEWNNFRISNMYSVGLTLSPNPYYLLQNAATSWRHNRGNSIHTSIRDPYSPKCRHPWGRRRWFSTFRSPQIST